jgi:hypothetical protein
MSVECTLVLGYALSLALVALLLEWVARYTHRRSVGVSTAGFTYHPDKDIWKCPKDQHLFPVFSDHARGMVIYRAAASACNACPSKAACTDSNQGREIERSTLGDLEYGMKRFHHAVSLTLLTLASLILLVELLRSDGLYPKVWLAATLCIFGVVIQRRSARLFQAVKSTRGVE